jgi:hypothetical protein
MVEFYFFHHGRNVTAYRITNVIEAWLHHEACPRLHNIKAVIHTEVNNETLGKCFQDLHVAALFVSFRLDAQ